MQFLAFPTLSPTPLPQAGEGKSNVPAICAKECAHLLPSPACGRGAGGEGALAIPKSQRGVTLLEALLATAIAALMLGTLMQLLSDSQTELRAKNVADQIQNFQRVAAHYYQSNRSQIMQAMENDSNGEAGEYCRVNLDKNGKGGTPAFDLNKNTCMIDASLLQARRLLPERGTNKTAHGEKLVAIFKRRYDDDKEILTQDVEMLVLTVLDKKSNGYTRNKARFSESSSIANYMGATGGVLPDQDRGKCIVDKSKGLFEVCGNGWKLDLQDFLDNSQLSNFRALL